VVRLADSLLPLFPENVVVLLHGGNALPLKALGVTPGWKKYRSASPVPPVVVAENDVAPAGTL